jgi:Dolichyl-phosphate-mannose-protein mannosyltransferase
MWRRAWIKERVVFLGEIVPMKRAFHKAATSLLLILVVAFGARVTFAWNQTRKIPAEILRTVPFQTETGHIAYSLTVGKGYSSPYERDSGPTAMLPPVYPLLVAGLFKIFGIYSSGAFFAAVFLNILFSSSVCVPIFYSGKRVAGVGVASLSAWLWALFPAAVMMPFEWIWDTSLMALFAATILWATVELAESHGWLAWCGYGLLWGLVLMTNPAPASLFPLLLGWLVYRTRGKERALGDGRALHKWWPHLARPALAAALALLCCLPWIVRNYAVFHRFIPLRSNLAFELYIGNNENYDERRRSLPPVITYEREVLRYLRIGETAFMDEEKRKALAFIASHPRVELELFVKRFVDFWMGTATPFRTFLESDSPLIRGILLGNFLSSVGALVGVVVLFLRRNMYAFPLAAFPAVLPFLYYLTHTSLRYRHPIDPIVLLLTAIAVGSLMRWPRPGTVHEAKPATIAPQSQGTRFSVEVNLAGCLKQPHIRSHDVKGQSSYNSAPRHNAVDRA